jgi:lipopolysaccharide biosynthesis glycosyltransferase
MKKMIPILVCGNQPLYPQLLFLTLSLSHSQKEGIALTILSGDFSAWDSRYTTFTPEEIAQLDGLLKKANPQSEVRLIDVSALAKKEFPKLQQFNHRYTVYSLFRLLADLLPFEGRLLYLDLDTVVLGELSPLFSEDLGGNDLGIVPDAVGRHFFGHTYGNSGVLVMDLAQIRLDHAFEKARKMINRHSGGMADQTALNKACSKRLLPERYNEQRKLQKDTLIRHYPRYFHLFPFPHDEAIRPSDGASFQKRYPGVHEALIEEFLGLLP